MPTKCSNFYSKNLANVGHNDITKIGLNLFEI